MKKIIIVCTATLMLVAGAGLLFLTLVDYRPEPVESLKIVGGQGQEAKSDQMFSIYTWNIGYGALGDDQDFFMDGGETSIVASAQRVKDNFNETLKTLEGLRSDFVMLQEVDLKSKRSHKINQAAAIDGVFEGYSHIFAKNFDVWFLPVPLPPLGRVKSGISTYSKYDLTSADRHAFEGNFSWPKKTVMLDRCFTVSRVALDDKAGDLVLINAHFSAYDDGSLKEGQLKTIKDFVVNLYRQGDYVVLGGDWNQTFESIDWRQYPLYKSGEIFKPSLIAKDWLEEGWAFGVADNAPTYRLLNAPYEAGISQVGVIDGFLVSPNIVIEEVMVIDKAFKTSDHNPVWMTFTLKE